MTSGEALRFLLLDLILIIAAARALGQVARRLGQPAVMGEIAAGIALGPTVLGRINPEWPGAVFPPEVPLRALADLGVIFFMFLVGLDLDVPLIRSQARRALAVSLAGVLAPLAGGVGLGVLLVGVNEQGRFLAGTEPPPHPLAFALFLGAAMSITAFPVLARILIDSGLARTLVGTVTLCAAAVDDVCAWILLAAVVGLTTAGSGRAAGWALVLTLGFVVAMLVVGRRLLAGLGRHYERAGRLTATSLTLVLLGVLGCALLTELIGIHALFGAFLFGALLPRHSPLVRDLREQLEAVTATMLLPVFFVVTGLRTDLFVLDTPALLGWLLAIVVVAIAGKLGGCGLAARLAGASTREAALIGVLMNTRGLTELVILTVGLNIGVLSDRVYAMMVVMALTTTLMTAPCVTWLHPRTRAASAPALGASGRHEVS